ncbi:MAG: L-threonylcarbamoyladenylate synthase [Firmicutes bacterium]|nr:L-threonylcarbamoyladenylate synthase [Bacillota bacterium]
MTKLLGLRDIPAGAAIIRNGGTVAFPTETVYGLGADATNDDAVLKIFAAKNRPSVNPLIVHFSSLRHLLEYFPNLTNDERKVLAKITRAITLVVDKGVFTSGQAPNPTHDPQGRGFGPFVPSDKHDNRIAAAALGGQNTVAVRIPSCKWTRRFIDACGVPLVAPSANTSTRPSPTRYTDVHADLDGRVDAIFMGKQTAVGIESTVIRIDNGEITILRQGGVCERMLSKTGLTVSLNTDPEKKKQSPGTRFKHYSPSVPLVIGPPVGDGKIVVLCRTQNRWKYRGYTVIPLGRRADAVAHNLFAAMRDAEKIADIIFVERMPQTQEFAGVNERLEKASQNCQ